MAHLTDLVSDAANHADLRKVRTNVRRRFLFAILVPLTMVFLRASPVGSSFVCVTLVLPVLFLAWAINAIWTAISSKRFVHAKQWVDALLGIVPLVFLVIVAFAAPSALNEFNDLGMEVRFLALRQEYLHEVAEMPSVSGEPKLRVFMFGGMIGASEGIVYDESDELGLPPTQRSRLWNARAYQTELICKGVVTRPFLRFTGITDHFFLASFSC